MKTITKSKCEKGLRGFLLKGSILLMSLLCNLNFISAQNNYTTDAGSRDYQNNEVYVLNNDYTINRGSGIRFNSRSGDSKRAFILYNTHNNLTFSHSASSSVTNAGDQLLTLTRLGALGLGTSLPGSKFHVSANQNSIFESFMLENKNSGSNALAVLRIRNNGTSDLVLFKNSSTRTADGGQNAATLRNDGGHLNLQSQGGNGLVISKTSGNVGIGTSSPSKKLQVNGDIQIDGSRNLYTRHIKGMSLSDGNKLYLQHGQSGDVIIGGASGADVKLGIGINNPEERIHVNSGNIRLDNSGKAKIRHLEGIADTGGAAEGLYLNWYTGKKVVVGSNVSGKRSDLFVHGNMGIGNESPSAKLDVSGDIKADKVILNIGSFPDYVFKSDYELLSLNEVETFINENGRLPKMPSEKQVVENGMDVEAINLLLVEKVEELTLYLIELKKESNELRVKVEDLKKENK